MRWAKLIDQSTCIGCHACTTACKSENEVPLSVTRTYVKYVDIGTYPHARRAFQVTRCNQCDDAPCVAACPTSAMVRRPDGIVDFDKQACIGCKACMAACPYDAIFINPDDHSAEKCNLCAHRLELELEPACVTVCPVGAIIVGDLDDPSSKLAELVQREPVSVRRPEKGTRPKLFYRGADQATLDPLAARRPPGGLFMWSEQHGGAGMVLPGHPGAGRRGSNSSAAAVLAYDIGHRVPWDWRVGLYTWTKGLAAGAYLAPLVLALAGRLDWSNALWRWAAPVVALTMLALTGAVLIWDLEHPRRFHYLFLRPQWRSWLVRGAVAITAFAGLLVLHLVLSAAGAVAPQRWLALVAGPVALLTAVYTGFLFAQAKARDLWQSPLLVPQLVAQALLLGAALALPFAHWLAPAAIDSCEWILAGSALAQVLMAAGEVTLTHPTEHAYLAAREMTHGRFARFFWTGLVFCAVAAFAPLIGIAAVPLALIAVLAHEHAYVQAGQAVPLA